MRDDEIAKSVIEVLSWGCVHGNCRAVDRFQCLKQNMAGAADQRPYYSAPMGIRYFCFCRCHPGNEYPNPGLPIGVSK